jgi:hypothetical protein
MNHYFVEKLWRFRIVHKYYKNFNQELFRLYVKQLLKKSSDYIGYLFVLIFIINVIFGKFLTYFKTHVILNKVV